MEAYTKFCRYSNSHFVLIVLDRCDNVDRDMKREGRLIIRNQGSRDGM